MSDLPKYTREADEAQELEPLTKGARESFESIHEESQLRTGYPPTNAEASSSSGSEQHVTYTFEPQGHAPDQHVLGILGRDRRVCLISTFPNGRWD